MGLEHELQRENSGMETYRGQGVIPGGVVLKEPMSEGEMEARAIAQGPGADAIRARGAASTNGEVEAELARLRANERDHLGMLLTLEDRPDELETGARLTADELVAAGKISQEQADAGVKELMERLERANNGEDEPDED